MKKNLIKKKKKEYDVYDIKYVNIKELNFIRLSTLI